MNHDDFKDQRLLSYLIKNKNNFEIGIQSICTKKK